MDDEFDVTQTPVSAWLAFTLSFDASARHCHFIRQSRPSVRELGRLIQQFHQKQSNQLALALDGELEPANLQRLHSTEIAEKIDGALQWSQSSPTNHLIGLDHPSYPALLRDTSDAPPVLYAKGNLSALDSPRVAIVGSRKASLQSIRHTRSLAAHLAQHNVCIVSGLAIGIDAAAHEGALDAQGVTIAVAATEPESVYPKRHHSLAQRIIDGGGLILTEYPLGSPTLRWFFPKRNRIISGMSSGVIVAEAALPSGTLTTANHAMNQGREVMAVPGSVHNPQSKGCHSLIKQGAALVENATDIIDALGPGFQRQLEKHIPQNAEYPDRPSATTMQHDLVDNLNQNNNQMETRILDLLRTQPATIDDLLTQVQLSVSELSTLLGLLEIKGRITSTAGGRYIHC